MSDKITDVEYDALRESGNIGIGNAATALSKLLEKKVDINIPETKFVPLEKFSEEVGGAERNVVGLYLSITGEITGECLFMFPQEGAFELIDLIMMRNNGETKALGEMEESAFKEMSNIFVGSYLTALGKLLSMKILPSVPHTASDMAQSIMDFMLIKLAKSADQLLCVKSVINVDGHDIQGIFILIFEDESLKKMVDALHKLYLM